MFHISLSPSPSSFPDLLFSGISTDALGSWEVRISRGIARCSWLEAEKIGDNDLSLLMVN